MERQGLCEIDEATFFVDFYGQVPVLAEYYVRRCGETARLIAVYEQDQPAGLCICIPEADAVALTFLYVLQIGRAHV